MKKFAFLAVLGLVILATGCKTEGGAGDVALSTKQDSLGYAIGSDIGKNLKMQNIDVALPALYKGLEDAFSGKPGLLTEEQTKAVIMSFQRDMQMKMQQERMAKAGGNLTQANEFLAQNKTKPGVIEHPSGLQYEVIKEGKGKSPTINDQVTTHYHGTLVDGTVFDSSVERGEPSSFPLGGVIQAWQIILPMMKEGGKVKIYCPPALGYGEMGMGEKIGPNMALIFEIELIKVGA
jgi:FKBP-type peptidyl-prolyl cis-trans isomerase FklB